jgi:hypothetical protein
MADLFGNYFLPCHVFVSCTVSKTVRADMPCPPVECYLLFCVCVVVKNLACVNFKKERGLSARLPAFGQSTEENTLSGKI